MQSVCLHRDPYLESSDNKKNDQNQWKNVKKNHRSAATADCSKPAPHLPLIQMSLLKAINWVTFPSLSLTNFMGKVWVLLKNSRLEIAKSLTSLLSHDCFNISPPPEAVICRLALLSPSPDAWYCPSRGLSCSAVSEIVLSNCG